MILLEIIAADAFLIEAKNASDNIKDHGEDSVDQASFTLAVILLAVDDVIIFLNLAANTAESIVFLLYPIVIGIDGTDFGEFAVFTRTLFSS